MLAIAALAVAVVVAAAVSVFLVLDHRQSERERWQGFPRTTYCRQDPPPNAELLANPEFSYLPDTPPEVTPVSVTLEALGGRELQIRTTFAAPPPPPPRYVLLPDWNGEQPEPGSIDFSISIDTLGSQVARKGSSVTTDPRYLFLGYADATTERVLYQEGSSSEQRMEPVYSGNTFTVTADFSNFQSIPTGAAFNPQIGVSPIRENRKFLAEPNFDPPPASSAYPTFTCDQAQRTSSTEARPSVETTPSDASTPPTTSDTTETATAPTLNGTCSESQAGTVTADATTGQNIACTFLGSGGGYKWVQSAPVSPGTHERGDSCDPATDKVGRSTGGGALLCVAEPNGTNGSWEPGS